MKWDAVAADDVAGGQPYRFLTPAERLPEGLPSEFTSKDRDGDGQLSMAEFSTSWSESTLASFNRWDLNGDGFVTAAECLAAENRSAGLDRPKLPNHEEA